MGGYPCCCLGPCRVFSDNFEDPASTTLDPTKWTEEAGDWEYDGTTFLRENGTVDASVLTTIETESNEQVVSTSIDSRVVGDKHRVIYNAVDEQNYHFVELEDATPDILRWFRREGGNNILLREEIMESGGPAGETEISVCSTRTSTTVDFAPIPTGQLYYLCNPNLFLNGRKAGLGNGATKSIEYNDFNLDNYRGNDRPGFGSDAKICCLQQCHCIENGKKFCISHILTATLSATGGCEEIFDGVTFDLIYYPLNGDWESYSSDIIHSTGDTPADIGTEGPHPLCADGQWWRLSCGVSAICSDVISPGKSFAASNEILEPGECAGFDDCTGLGSAEASFSCDPIVIIFPPDLYNAVEPPTGCQCCDDMVDGGYTLIITEQ